MKLKAIRVQNIGVLQAPTALEGLSGELDVIAAPNEAGKSTLFRAVTFAFTEEFKANTQPIRNLRSAGGGAPTVEIDVEIGGRDWRLGKRYLTKAMARLAPLAGGPSFDNADAEAQLTALLGSTACVRPLLWVAQETATAQPAPTAAAAGVLKSQLAADIATAVGTGLVDAVRAQVTARLAELLTPKTGKPTGDLLRAERAMTAAAMVYAAAEALASEVAERRARLAQLAADEAALADPVASKERTARLDAARLRITVAEQAEAQLKNANAAFRSAEETLARATDDRARLADRLVRLDTTTARLTTLDADLARHAAALAGATARVADTDRILAAARRRDVQRRHGVLRARLTAVDAALAQASAAARAAAATANDPGAVAVAQRAARTLEVLDAELAASVASVDLVLTAGGRDKVRINGEVPASPSSPLLVDRAIVIDIVGVGTVTIHPGGGRARDDSLARRAQCRTELATALDACGVASLAEAEARRASADANLAAQRAAEAAAAVASAGQTRAQFAAELERLEGALAEASRAAPEDAVHDHAAADDQSLDAAIADHAAATGALDQARDALRTVQHALDLARSEARQLAADLPHADLRAADLERLAAAIATADLACRSAAVERGALRDSAPTPEAMAQLGAEVAAAMAAVRDADARLGRLRTEIAEINGRLMEHERAAGADARGDLPQLAAEAERTARALARIHAERDALKVLDQELTRAAADDQQTYVTPIMARLAPLLARVFPAASIDWTADLGIAALSRAAGSFTHLQLSIGTREQLSVLVRLAFADLLADRGRSIPVILDDALVYADDERRDRMFAALAAAARRHQVIVLTCHQAFARQLAERHGAAVHVMRPWPGQQALGTAA